MFENSGVNISKFRVFRNSGVNILKFDVCVLCRIKKKKEVTVSLEHEKEMKLGKQLLKLPEVITRSDLSILKHEIKSFM